jgi:tetratricopeptide (TPR) repeat protein
MVQSKQYHEIEACVAKVMEMDPDNERAKNLVLLAKQNIEDIAENKSRKAEILRRRNFITSTYDKAKEDTAAKRYPAAISKLEIVEKDSASESNGLKQKAKDDILKIKDQMTKESRVFLDQAKASFDAKEYRSALAKFSKAIALAPFNTEAKAMREKAANEIHQEMKNIYSESVIEENLGNIDSAKAKWSKIINDDENSDPYYQKAQMKLRKYDR